VPFGKREAKHVDRRREEREPTDVDATIILPGTIMMCRVVDSSKTGARLSLTSILGIPEEFDLRVRGQTYRAKVVRKTPRGLGVKFV
jgi:hypothetical protein